MKKARPMDYYVDIPVAPEDMDRFKKGCEHYGMTIRRNRGSVYLTIGTNNLIDLYWLGANMFNPVPTTGLHKHVF